MKRKAKPLQLEDRTVLLIKSYILKANDMYVPGQKFRGLQLVRK